MIPTSVMLFIVSGVVSFGAMEIAWRWIVRRSLQQFFPPAAVGTCVIVLLVLGFVFNVSGFVNGNLLFSGTAIGAFFWMVLAIVYGRDQPTAKESGDDR